MTKLAAFYHRDKLDYTLNQPLEFVSGRDGVSTDAFDYFPEEHYRQGFEQLRGEVNDGILDEWMDQVLGHTPVKASHGGLWRGGIPPLVADILSSSHRFEAEITIKPEAVPDGYDYHVEWQYVDFDREDMKWKPVNKFEDSEG